MRSVCLVRWTCGLELALDRVGQLGRVGDQHGGGERVVLGLADQVGGDVDRVGGGVGEDRDLGRAGLGVDADHALEQALRGGDVDVAGAGDQDGRAALLGAVGEHRDRLRAAGRVHLVDAEQRAGRQDRRVRQPAELPLRGRGDRERGDARLLRGHDVHDHAGGVDRLAARDVEPDALDGHPALGDRAAGDDLRGHVRTALVAVDQPGAADALLERVAHGGGRGRRAHAGSPRRARARRPARRRRSAPCARAPPRLRDVLRRRRSAAPSPGRLRRRARLAAARRAGHPAGTRAGRYGKSPDQSTNSARPPGHGSRMARRRGRRNGTIRRAFTAWRAGCPPGP